MKNTFRSLIVATAGLTLLISGCGNGPPAGSSSAAGGGGSSVGTAGANLGTATLKIDATDAQVFTPATGTAKVGQIVEWDNTGTTTPHTVTFDDAGVSDSSLNPGDTWQIKFTKAGTYNYRCTIHPDMTATLTVS